MQDGISRLIAMGHETLGVGNSGRRLVWGKSLERLVMVDDEEGKANEWLRYRIRVTTGRASIISRAVDGVIWWAQLACSDCSKLLFKTMNMRYYEDIGSQFNLHAIEPIV